MTDYKKFAFTTVNNYIADYLESQDIMAKTITVKGKQQPSIVPAAQTPELVDASSPGAERAPAFIVYSYELDQHPKKEWNDCEKMGYTIFAPTVSKTAEIMHALRDLFRRNDWSAADVNQYAQDQNKKAFHFTDFDYELVAGPVPTTNEGGRYAAMVNIHYVYILSQDGTSRPGEGLGLRS